MDAGPVRPAPADESARLAAFAAACMACALVIYAAASHTSLGRRVDASALERQRDSFSPWQVATWVFETVNVVSIAAVVVAILLVARARGRTRFGAGVAIAVVTAILVSDVAKHGLRRIEDGPFYPSFPSGHATAALAAGLGAALVAGPRSRPAVIALAVLAAAAVGIASIVIHAHRPSDVAGGYLVAIGCIAAVLAVLSRLRRAPVAGAPPPSGRLSPLVRWLTGAGLALMALGAVAGLAVQGSSEVVDAGLVGATFGVLGAATLAGGAFLHLFPSTARAGGPDGRGGVAHGALEGTGPLAR